MVRIILGSKSDIGIGDQIKSMLDDFGVRYDLHISSAHRNPEQTKLLASEAEILGYQVIIAAAGMAAHLPGVIASYTILPVIGVPLSGSALSGIDSLYSVVQMPTGIPVATVAVDGAKNAAILAIEILALSDPGLKLKLQSYRQSFVS
ncbi:MAG TPA: 5-(carboxyamino)imidazole ribonucleotide mutase [Candidatus Cloacimonadota bacterium]|nr:5-(carboxyamino)imidazole ribonucleotide mutase [Candidatus Cloacimonadota bacterium]HPT70947.1 5-(carboxyamino)imidazole ribonucleotide mutase [Candidatus Cloacimonadota bacterium]